ncbi:copine [Catovirus CTV1]|uniref:Copine n=1 Tax=Catovirus CTV1 TaxID=1977631 RepID=A0A1V0SAP6_9VIRU|nr:copine [Catovirus CTV1]
MGNIFKKQKKIRIFDDSLNLSELKQYIIKSKVNNDCDFLFFIDVTKSNLFMDGTTRHDFINNGKCSKYVLTNPYLSVLDIIKDFPFCENTNFLLYFYGTLKASLSENNLEKICIGYNDDTKELFKKNSNIYFNINEIIDAYNYGIEIINNKNLHLVWGNNSFHRGVPLINIIDESIKIAKKSQKFTTSIIFTDGFDKNYDKTDIYNILNKLIEATNYPIEFICICVGNNNFDLFSGFDDFDHNKIGVNKKKLTVLEKKRNFDNFKTVVLRNIVKRNLLNKLIRDEIYRNIFVELPQVYEYIKRKNIINYQTLNTNDNKQIVSNNYSDIRNSVLEIDLNDNNKYEISNQNSNNNKIDNIRNSIRIN